MVKIAATTGAKPPATLHATSEPVHRIAVATGAEESPLHISTTRWLINEGNTLAGRSIKELEIRANTGASIISIYRDGANLSNPSPETKLMPVRLLHRLEF